MTVEPIVRVDKLPPEVFRAEYDRPGLPVVITNALNWPALERWTHEWFRDTYGHTPIELTVNPTHTQRVIKMRLEAYIQRILDNYRMDGGLYLAQFSLMELPGLAKDFSVPPYCHPDRIVLPHLWLGPGTTVLSFHKDNHNPLVQINNIFVQIRGRKRFILASPDNDAMMYPRPPEIGAYWHSLVDPETPDLEKFPLFANARLQEAIVGPGDIIFVPRNYWHHVRALERSISLSFWWHPYRLMEIAWQLCTESDGRLEELQSCGKLTVSYSDILEIGGPARLETAFREFNHSALLQMLCARLAAQADDATREAIDAALRKSHSTLS
jgi:lysine-specific demethylase 8